jgi:transcription elongation GreA/GreB family factor
VVALFSCVRMTPNASREPLDKAKLLDLIVERLSAELARAKDQAASAADGATHEEARSDSDKDMRSTEASYVARGHAERTLRLERALTQLSHLVLVDCARSDRVQASAIVELEHGGQRALYFLVPAAGGEHFVLGAHSVQTLSPTSPLGRALLGLGMGDEAEVDTPQGTRVYEITRLE